MSRNAVHGRPGNAELRCVQTVDGVENTQKLQLERDSVAGWRHLLGCRLLSFKTKKVLGKSGQAGHLIPRELREVNTCASLCSTQSPD